ncbi:MAG: YihA family ribosome biogenesis GTP-binding protein, partial [Bacteroidota bacterium]|nr:YihA family ribosome biogenesis GTP-binding protein [Bacteroidota bacterium]
AYKERLLERWEELPPVFVTSSTRREGREELLQYIKEINASL